MSTVAILWIFAGVSGWLCMAFTAYLFEREAELIEFAPLPWTRLDAVLMMTLFVAMPYVFLPVAWYFRRSVLRKNA